MYIFPVKKFKLLERERKFDWTLVVLYFVYLFLCIRKILHLLIYHLSLERSLWRDKKMTREKFLISELCCHASRKLTDRLDQENVRLTRTTTMISTRSPRLISTITVVIDGWIARRSAYRAYWNDRVAREKGQGPRSPGFIATDSDGADRPHRYDR